MYGPSLSLPVSLPILEVGLYEDGEAPAYYWLKTGETLILADALAAEVFGQARVPRYHRRADVEAATLGVGICAHPLEGHHGGYHFEVPLLEGDHVTDDAGTGFVHPAPAHGREDLDVWMQTARPLPTRRTQPS